MFFDSHGHLEDKRFNEDREQVINDLKENGVSNFINVGSNVKTSLFSAELAKEHDFIYFAAGIHPSDSGSSNKGDLEMIEGLLEKEKCVALGEIGLDFYYDFTDKDTQRRYFEEQAKMAKKHNIPVIIHDRDAHEECYEMVKKHDLRGVFHCYTGSAEFAKKLLDIGFYISFTGVLTFKNARKSVEAAEIIPMDRLLIETDCPYMAPEPHRGKRNEPKYVRYVAEKLAQIKGLSVDEIAKITADNTKRLFGIK